MIPCVSGAELSFAGRTPAAARLPRARATCKVAALAAALANGDPFANVKHWRGREGGHA